jgi:hypothetical protein
LSGFPPRRDSTFWVEKTQTPHIKGKIAFCDYNPVPTIGLCEIFLIPSSIMNVFNRLQPFNPESRHGGKPGTDQFRLKWGVFLSLKLCLIPPWRENDGI